MNPAIVIRHFGSKERLFLLAVDATSGWRTLLAGPVEELGLRAARAIIEGRPRGLEIWGTMVRASGRPEIRASLRTAMNSVFAEPLIDRLPGPNPSLRAHAFTAQLVGLMSALVVYDDAVLSSAPVDELVELYGATLQRILTDP